VQQACRKQVTRSTPIAEAMKVKLQKAADQAAHYGVIQTRSMVADALNTGFSLATG
jgi:hypothetical protein